MAGDFFNDYFVKPIWDRVGYNPVNTLIYAVIALAFAFIIYKGFEKYKVKIDQKFFLQVLPFILLGSTMRVVTDSIDSGVLQNHTGDLFGLTGIVVNSHIWDYGYFTVTPGVYFLTAALLFGSLALSRVLKKEEIFPGIGLVLWAFHFIILIPLFTYWSFALMILGIAGIVGLAAYFASKLIGIEPFSSVVVFAHALDGAATWVIIDIFSKVTGRSYFEQHVVSDLLGKTAIGFALFFLVKVLFSSAAVFVIEKDDAKRQEKNYILLLLFIFGLAPGMRDVLRMLCGV
ncbi:Uncharacterised protein [Candidatus Gugararchaeum adminiculabundum]|nr:Uncharacterised protein [Candidatus Gugararchaeum adminiculabundum]